MPRLFPEGPAFEIDWERQVWERLRDSFGNHDVLLANIRLTDRDKDHEADLVVLMLDFGVLVLEVKGGSVWVRPTADVRRGTSRLRHIPRSAPGRPGAGTNTRCVGTSMPPDFGARPGYLGARCGDAALVVPR